LISRQTLPVDTADFDGSSDNDVRHLAEIREIESSVPRFAFIKDAF